MVILIWPFTVVRISMVHVFIVQNGFSSFCLVFYSFPNEFLSKSHIFKRLAITILVDDKHLVVCGVRVCVHVYNFPY